MELVRDNIINEVFRAIAMVFALILGNCSGDNDAGTSQATSPQHTLAVEFIAKTEVFTPTHPVKFESTFDYDGRPALILALLPPDDMEFGAFTDRHTGEQIEMTVCGEVIMSPIIQSAIYGGKVFVTGPDNHQKMLNYISNGCP